jgi:aryl-alcohol dehydrogenase-like predicted oxidoreductase
MWDSTTPVVEVMRALDDAVRAGKLLHIAISDTPAWIILQANVMAELRGWTPFAGMQAYYSLVRRDAERDLLPVCAAFEISPMVSSTPGNGVLN